MENEISQQKNAASKSIIKYILLTGLLAGTLDISAAFINYMISSGAKNPVVVLNFIASGVFDKAAFSDGFFYPLSGLLFHFIIAYSFTTFFFLLYPKAKSFLKNKYLAGVIFGLFTWLVMNLIVLPLSNTPLLHRSAPQIILSVLFLVFFIGFPAAIIADKFYSQD